MDDEQIDVMTVLLAQHIVDIARCDAYVAYALRSHLLNIPAHDDTRCAIEALIEDLVVPSIH